MKSLVIIAVSALLASCSDSLFDANGGKDAGVAIFDASTSSDAPDFDAAPVVNTCPDPCEGDAVADFDTAQGGSNGRWLYRADSRAPSGLDYPALSLGEVDSLPAWRATSGPAAILSCFDNPTAPLCQGTTNHLLLIPARETTDDSDPVLTYVAPEDGNYKFSGQLRSPDGATTNLAQRFSLVRNARHDLLRSQSFVSSTGDETFSVTVSALAGDQISFTLLPNESSLPAPMAVQLFVTQVNEGDEVFPASCQFAATFDGASPLIDRCHGATMENLNDGIGPAGESVDTDSASPQYDRARLLGEGQYLRSIGAPADYSGDFTIQLWAKLDAAQPTSIADLFADWNDAARGGVNIAYRSSTAKIETCYIWNDPALADTSACITTNAPTDGEWHFYRVARDAAGISLCIDGSPKGSDPATGTFDMTSDRAPHLGRNVNYNPAYFAGALDDLRIFSRALPCSIAP